MGLYIDGKPATVEPLIINELLQGYIDWRKTLGGEKVTNGTFTGAATGWTLNTGWTYNANAVDRDGVGTATMEQNVNSIAGEVYRVEYEITAYTDGSVTVSIGGTSGTSRSSAAVFVEYLKAATTGNLIFTPVANATFTIDNVSVKKVGYVAADGVTAWIEDRGATAGKGALHLVTEDGTGHVFSDRVGIGTLYPTAAFDVAVAARFGSTVTFAGALAGGAQALTNLGSLLIGSATAYGINSEALEVHQVNALDKVGFFGWDNGDTAQEITFYKSGSDTIGVYTAITTGHAMGYLTFVGADGTDFQNAAYLVAKVTGTVGDNRVPGLLEFHLYSDAASSVDTTVMSINATTITIGSAITIAGAGTGANGFKIKNPKNAAASALSGTQLDVEIDIGGTPYYFTVYPTKA